MFIVTLSVSMVNAKKPDKIFRELTRTMMVSVPTETIKHQNAVVPYWRIPNGGFYYLTTTQEFKGKHKNYNFTSTSNTTSFLGITKKEERHAKKHLKSDIISSREFY